MLRGFFSFCLFLFGLGLTAQASEDGVLSDKEVRMVGVAWGGYWKADGTGYYPELLREIYEAEGYTVSLRVVPWGRARALLLSGAADVLMGEWDGAKDRALYLYSEDPLHSETIICLALRSAALRCGDAYQQVGRRIAWVNDMDFQDGLPNPVRAEVIEVPNSEVGLRMLGRHRIDGFMHYPRALMEDLDRLDAIEEPVSVSERLDIPVYALFNRSQRGNTLKTIFDQRFAVLKSSGDWVGAHLPLQIEEVIQALAAHGMLVDGAAQSDASTEPDGDD